LHNLKKISDIILIWQENLSRVRNITQAGARLNMFVFFLFVSVRILATISEDNVDEILHPIPTINLNVQ
jgi:hypothetical protein